jgi:hypothetical protein
VSAAEGIRPARGVRHALPALAVVVALVLVWRVFATGAAALLEGTRAAEPERARAPVESGAPDAPWRARLARNPTDYAALVVLALELERQGKTADARDAMRAALRLAPADERTLVEAAAFHLRTGDEAQALAILRRALDLYPSVQGTAWPFLTAALDGGRSAEFFSGIARENPAWWLSFFRHACRSAADVDAVQRLLAARSAAGVAVPDEWRCLIGRLQRENRWANAYQAWLNSLPREQQKRVGYVFNGDFEAAPSNMGFDWIVAEQPGVSIATQAIDGAGGRRALHVEFVRKRWAGPPVQQYLMLFPGRYKLEGRGRSDGLETWLGVQWGLYCLEQAGKDGRQLARSDRFRGMTNWVEFAEDFTVPRDCGAQVLRLELANPRRDADVPGNVAARLNGSVWFDDFRVRSLD